MPAVTCPTGPLGEVQIGIGFRPLTCEERLFQAAVGFEIEPIIGLIVVPSTTRGAMNPRIAWLFRKCRNPPSKADMLRATVALSRTQMALLMLANYCL